MLSLLWTAKCAEALGNNSERCFSAKAKINGAGLLRGLRSPICHRPRLTNPRLQWGPLPQGTFVGGTPHRHGRPLGITQGACTPAVARGTQCQQVFNLMFHKCCSAGGGSPPVPSQVGCLGYTGVKTRYINAGTALAKCRLFLLCKSQQRQTLRVPYPTSSIICMKYIDI